MKNLINQSINRFAYDFSSINQLKRNAVSGSTDSIKQVADQFERSEERRVGKECR